MKKVARFLIIIIIVSIFIAIISYKQITIESSKVQSSPENIISEESKEQPIEEKIWNQRIESALATENCITPENRKFGDLYYNGQLIDTHFHIANIPDSTPSEQEQDYSNEEMPLLGVNTKITDIICTLEKEGTKKVFAFFPVYKEVSEPMIELVKRTMKEYPDNFVPFIMAPDHDDSVDGFPTVESQILQNMLNIEQDLFKGYGEIGLYARGDHGGPKGSPELPPDSQRLQEIYPIIRENNLIIYFHLGENQEDSFKKVLEQNPDINFIWHGDQLIPYEDGKQNLKLIDEILTNYPNAYYGVDELYGDTWILKPETKKEDFIKHFDDYEILLNEDISTWKAFIEKHPNQVLWGTDRGWSAPWSVDEDVGIILTNYARAFIARLDPEVQEKFAYKNAEKLINGNI
ncbi:MAG: hypothetical protein AABX23_02465 [Nanoarchaeota archaeon]